MEESAVRKIKVFRDYAKSLEIALKNIEDFYKEHKDNPELVMAYLDFYFKKEQMYV